MCYLSPEPHTHKVYKYPYQIQASCYQLEFIVIKIMSIRQVHPHVVMKFKCTNWYLRAFYGGFLWRLFSYFRNAGCELCQLVCGQR